jgi:spermidine synthase
MQTPYPLLPLGIFTTLLYIISHMLVRLNIWTKTTHLKIWNVILLLVFLPTAILGLLLAIQINYKLEWEIIDKLLKWHVDTGIVLCFVAIFHLIWHFSYYVNLFKRKKSPEIIKNEKQALAQTDIHGPWLLIFLSGFIATVVQVLIIRGLTTLLEGNEFMMGWTIGIWMLLTGTGAFLGRKFNTLKINIISTQNILLAISAFPPVLLVLLNLIKNSLFLPGMQVSPLLFIFVSFLVLGPTCLLTGFLYSLFVRSIQSDKKNFIRVYAIESLGSIAGGVTVSFLLINWLTVLQSLFLLLFLISFILFLLRKVKTNLILSLFAGTITALLFFSPLENLIRSRVFSNQKILENKDTFYGNITVTGQAGEYNFFNNGSLIFSSGNFIVQEEYAHYALLQCVDPKKVLIVSGGISGIANEVLKYSSVKQVDCIEINQELIGLGRKYSLLPRDSRVNFIYSDVKRSLKKSHSKYDAVIMAVPAPSSLQANRYYTDEFLSVLKKNLNPGAIVLYGVSSTGNYMGNAQANKLIVLINTLKKHFKNVKILPGEKDYLLVSDSTISLDISELYSKAKVENSYVNSDYIDDASIQMRSGSIAENLPKNSLINTNNRPLPVFFDTLRYTSQFYTTRNKFIYLPLLLLLLPLFFMKPESTGMYIAGFSGASIEILLIFAFQITYGYIYAAIGFIVALFMTGMVIGSLLGYRWKVSAIQLPVLQAGLILHLVILPFIFEILQNQNSAVLFWPFFILITLLPAILIGYFYVVASSLHGSKTSESAPAVYAADLIGSSLGAIATTILLVPLLGIDITCYLLAGFNLMAGAYYFIRRKLQWRIAP